MALTKEDIIELQEILDDRYVQQKNCDDIQIKNNNKFNNDNNRINNITDVIASFKKFVWIIITALVSESVISLLTLLKSV